MRDASWRVLLWLNGLVFALVLTLDLFAESLLSGEETILWVAQLRGHQRLQEEDHRPDLMRLKRVEIGGHRRAVQTDRDALPDLPDLRASLERPPGQVRG